MLKVVTIMEDTLLVLILNRIADQGQGWIQDFGKGGGVSGNC